MLRVFENKGLRIFGPKRDEVTGEYRKLHNEEINYLYSPNIVWVVKLRRMRRNSSNSILNNLLTCLFIYLFTY